jgi:hypothetical protein
MTKGGSKYTKIKINTETGELVKITDEKNNPATEMTPEEVEQMYQNQNGFEYIGLILHTHSSPGCVVYYSGGKYKKICW